MARFSNNQPLKGIEIYFEDRPSADVLSELKANRWRWLYSKKCWYNTNTQVNLEYAQRICSPKVNLPVVSNVHTIDYDITSSQGNSEESKVQKNGNLVECFDCHHIVSIHAQSCPNCGCPLSYTLEQYSRIAQEREAVQKRAEEGTKQEENEEINHRVEVESEDVFEDIVSEGIEAFVQDALEEVSRQTMSENEDGEFYFFESECHGHEDSEKSIPPLKKVEKLDTLVYKDATAKIVQVKVNPLKDEGHKKYLGLKIGDAFLDSKGYRCVVVDIIRKDPYQGWKDLAPTLSVDNYPSVNFGHKRKWHQK